MQMVRVSKDASRIKVAKKRTPVTYDTRDVMTSSALAGWQPVSHLELSVAL